MDFRLKKEWALGSSWSSSTLSASWVALAPPNIESVVNISSCSFLGHKMPFQNKMKIELEKLNLSGSSDNNK
jgi:hypothetical protein